MISTMGETVEREAATGTEMVTQPGEAREPVFFSQIVQKSAERAMTSAKRSGRSSSACHRGPADAITNVRRAGLPFAFERGKHLVVASSA